MSRSQQVLAFTALGCVPPVAFIIYHGLQNEGWGSLRFLFYPGVETYLTAVLLIGVLTLCFTHLSHAARHARAYASHNPAFAFGAFVAGLLFSATLLWWLGHDELTMRKFYT